MPPYKRGGYINPGLIRPPALCVTHLFIVLNVSFVPYISCVLIIMLIDKRYGREEIINVSKVERD